MARARLGPASSGRRSLGDGGSDGRIRPAACGVGLSGRPQGATDRVGSDQSGGLRRPGALSPRPPFIARRHRMGCGRVVARHINAGSRGPPRVVRDVSVFGDSSPFRPPLEGPSHRVRPCLPNSCPTSARTPTCAAGVSGLVGGCLFPDPRGRDGTVGGHA